MALKLKQKFTNSLSTVLMLGLGIGGGLEFTKRTLDWFIEGYKESRPLIRTRGIIKPLQPYWISVFKDNVEIYVPSAPTGRNAAPAMLTLSRRYIDEDKDGILDYSKDGLARILSGDLEDAKLEFWQGKYNNFKKENPSYFF